MENGLYAQISAMTFCCGAGLYQHALRESNYKYSQNMLVVVIAQRDKASLCIKLHKKA
jgi:hypothetical protein